MSANSYWIDDRLRSQRVATRTLPNFVPARDISRNIVGTRTEVRRRGGIIPSWVVFSIIILATSGLCLSVIMRTVAEAGSAATTYEKMSSEVQKLREVTRISNRKYAVSTQIPERLKLPHGCG